jgi:hypothetical protein
MELPNKYVKVKQSLYSTGQALRVHRVWGFRFPDNGHRKLVRLSAPRTVRLYPQELFPVLISVGSLVDTGAIVRPEGLCQ